MTFTEFIKTYTPDYAERERKFIERSAPGALYFSGALKLFRENLFPEALENYTSEVISRVKEIKYKSPDPKIDIIEEKAP